MRLCLAMMSALVLSSALAVSAQAQQPKEPLWTHAFDLKCRKFGERDFDKNTQKFGVEAFKDTNNNVGVYISQVGSLAATTNGFKNIVKAITTTKGPDWITGLDLPARKAGKSEFKGATVHSMEVFHDSYTNNWIYITEKGLIAAAPAKTRPAADDNTPRLSHSVDLGVRKGGDKEWENVHKFGVEVYFDPSTGNLVYITDVGAIAAVPGTLVEGNSKDPVWMHGLDLKIRKHTEPKFDKNTKTVGVELYRDTNNGNLIFITENGFLAVVPGAKAAGKVEDPKWTHGMNMRCRKTGQEQFDADTPTFGVEVFLDENVQVSLYLSETGALTVVKAK